MEKDIKINSSGRIGRDIIIISIIAGFSGFVLGLLFAPQSGRKFRKFLVEQFKEIVDRSKFAVVEAKMMAEELFEKNREKDEELSS